MDKNILNINEPEEIEQHNEVEIKVEPVHPESMPSTFEKAVDNAKLNILNQASVEDQNFVREVKTNVKEATIKLTEVEKSKADLQKQNVQYQSEKLETEQIKNAHDQLEDKWHNKQVRREYHYEGVKPIMTFVGVNAPMNLILLYLITVIILPFFLIDKILRATIGTLIAGASDGNRSKAAKGFLWSIIALIALFALLVLVYLFFKWQGIDLLDNFR